MRDRIMHPELHALFQADQQERINHPDYGTPAYWALRTRDRGRRERVATLVVTGVLASAKDYFHAAMIFQHGESVEDAWQAYLLARHAAELDYQPARWLAAAAYDRWLMYQSRPQKYGTQFVPDGRRYRLWDLDPTTTDAERAAWDVSTLDQQQQRAEEMTRNLPMPPMHDAPQWLKDAFERWNAAHS